MLASDDRNTEFAGARNPDDILHVTFYMRAVQNNFETEKQQQPVFRDEQWVRILIPGRNDTEIEEPVEARHIQRFPRQWAFFKNMTADSESMEGTPVTEWPFLTRAQAEELRAKKFYTVQQVAACSDQQIQALGMNANLMRQKARIFLESAGAAANAAAHAEEIAKKEAENAALKAGQETLSAQVAQLTAQLASLIQTGAVKAHREKKEKKPVRNMSPEAREAAAQRMRDMHARKKSEKAAQVNG